MLTVEPIPRPRRSARHPKDPRPQCVETLKNGERCTKTATYYVTITTDRIEATRPFCGLHMGILQAKHQRLGDLPGVFE